MTLQEEVIRLVADRFALDPATIRPESNLADDLAADSLELIELVLELEHHFQVSLPEDRVRGLSTIDSLVVEIMRHRSARLRTD